VLPAPSPYHKTESIKLLEIMAAWLIAKSQN